MKLALLACNRFLERVHETCPAFVVLSPVPKAPLVIAINASLIGVLLPAFKRSSYISSDSFNGTPDPRPCVPGPTRRKEPAMNNAGHDPPRALAPPKKALKKAKSRRDDFADRATAPATSNQLSHPSPALTVEVVNRKTEQAEEKAVRIYGTVRGVLAVVLFILIVVLVVILAT